MAKSEHNIMNLYDLLTLEVDEEDIASYVLVKAKMDAANVRITDMAPAADELEVLWPEGFREWFSLYDACSFISDRLR